MLNDSTRKCCDFRYASNGFDVLDLHLYPNVAASPVQAPFGQPVEPCPTKIDPHESNEGKKADKVYKVCAGEAALMQENARPSNGK